jgi:hypothetical protein
MLTAKLLEDGEVSQVEDAISDYVMEVQPQRKVDRLAELQMVLNLSSAIPLNETFARQLRRKQICLRRSR